MRDERAERTGAKGWHQLQRSLERAVIMVLDSVGVGEAPDAHEYGDAGSNTLANTAKAVGGLQLPNLERLGIGNLTHVEGVRPRRDTLGAYGRMQERSKGKDTTTGHWELAGLQLDRAFPTYPQGFPDEIISAFEAAIGRRVLGNTVASGTVIIEALGKEHMETGRPIVYTSADSVFQVAAHEDVIPVDELYAICQTARGLLVGEHGVGRVIARPFVGEPGSFRRTAARKDFSLAPPEPTLLDHAVAAGIEVVAVGKVTDIFAARGITRSLPSADNSETIQATLHALDTTPGPAIIFANCVDFDSLYGHRNDPVGYAKALEDFDAAVPRLTGALSDGDALFIVADHGCDPTTPSTDHSRELVPVLVFGSRIQTGVDIGLRQSFADLAATIAQGLAIASPRFGQSFWHMICKG